jgi:surfactin synthase thioesterase subunit
VDQLRLTTSNGQRPLLPDSRWLRPIVTPSAARPRQVQLVMLPHAGGSAHTYRTWAPVLPDGVALAAVEYPGHGARLTEQPVDDPAVMVAELTGLLTRLQDRLDGSPLIVGGHSLGALLTHEVAAVLQARGRPVDGLLLSSALPAHRYTMVPDLSTLDDNALAAALAADGDIPPEILQDAEARALYLPMVRHGLAFSRRFCRAVAGDISDGPSDREPVHACAVVVGGADDARCPVVGLDTWAEVIDGPLEITVLPGRHFYYRQQPGAIGRVIADVVDRARGPVRS